MYRYYLTQRQAMPGTIPTSGVKTVQNFDDKPYCEEINRDAWGYVEYDKPLSREILSRYEMLDIPDNHVTGETVVTPRGTFSHVNLSPGEIVRLGYGLHHVSDDGKFYIVTNGNRAFAVVAGC